jgi:hypothetical protein
MHPQFRMRFTSENSPPKQRGVRVAKMGSRNARRLVIRLATAGLCRMKNAGFVRRTDELTITPRAQCSHITFHVMICAIAQQPMARDPPTAIGRHHAKHDHKIERGACHTIRENTWIKKYWRREWDSNPRDPYEPTRVPGERLQPLGHPSAICPERVALYSSSAKSQPSRKSAALGHLAPLTGCAAGHKGDVRPCQPISRCFYSSR